MDIRGIVDEKKGGDRLCGLDWDGMEEGGVCIFNYLIIYLAIFLGIVSRHLDIDISTYQLLTPNQ